MTATVPDVDAIEHLDFDHEVPCCVDECGDPKVAQPAVRLIVLTMPCCVRKGPVCAEHVSRHTLNKMRHGMVMCPSHRVITCACRTIDFAPLPGAGA